MSFKKLILSCTILSVLHACNLPIGEKPSQSLAPQAELGFERKCLSNVLPVMARFITGEAEPAEISGSWNCFQTGLDLFYRKVRGRNSNEYSSEELARFFEDYFFDDLKLSNSLRIEIMRIKQVLVGGSAFTLTREELLGLIRFAEVAKVASIEVLPHMKIISQNWRLDPKEKIDTQLNQFSEASLAFQKFLVTIGSQIQKNNIEYRLNYLINLLQEIASLYKKEWIIVTKVKKILPLIEKLKSSLVGGDGSLIMGDEWTRFSLLIGRGYIQYLRYHYFIKNYPIELAEYDVLFLGAAFDDLLSYLGDMVRNKPDRVLTKGNLQAAISSLKTLFPDLNVTEIFIDQILILKRLFFGGSTEFILASEFYVGREKVLKLQNIGTRFYSFGFIYFLRWLPESPMTDRERRTLVAATKEIELIGHDLGTLFESEYDLNNLHILVDELSNLFNWGDLDRSSITQLRKTIPLIIAAQKLITGSNSSVIQKSDWSKVTTFLSSLYGDYLQYWYGIYMGPSWRDSLKEYEILANRIKSRLDTLLMNHNDVIRQYHIDQMLSALFEADFISNERELLALRRIAHLLIHRILWPEQMRQVDEEPLGIRREHLDTLSESWTNFLTLHNWSLANIPTDKKSISRRDMSSLIKSSMPKEWHSRAHAIWVKPSTNLVSNELFLLRFDRSARNQIDRTSFQNQNLIRTLLELVAHAYSGSNGLFDLSKDRYDRLFDDFFPILVELDLVDPQNTSFQNNRFLEANLFTPSANGNTVLEYAEAVELMQFLFSGLQRHAKVLGLIQKNCQEMRNEFQRVEFALSCWLDQSHISLAETYQSMPEALKSYSDLSKKKFDKTWTAFLVGAGHKLNNKKTVPIDDFALVPHLVQYAESIFYRFDYDQNQHLTRDEAMSAYPIFREVLSSASGIKNERMLRGGYAYLLVHKKLPTTLGERINFITNWIYQEKSWPVWVNRAGMANVLQAIAKFLEDSKGIQEYQMLEESLPPQNDHELAN